ncbi:hypothetical protein L1987_20789 [Smallanthus sonchifolius]|uniref:Uncharacterized protein n=1 Tax=Smallanthus sonchifolius TaxID=185202 RepID=A0ACB9IS79_9ASTR|nr:hypothetical protein L1987_20789 [Smallanthus sonchifolius]
MQFVLSFNGYKITEKTLSKHHCLHAWRRALWFFIVCTSDILSAWSVSVLQQKVVSAVKLEISSKIQLSTAADDMPISSKFGLQQIRLIRSRYILQQKNKYPLQISLSAAACWSAANSEVSSICT